MNEHAADHTIPVTVETFRRAETDMYFAGFARRGGFGRLDHNRAPTPVDRQDVVRMNRDTLYSVGVFDLDAGPVAITLPDTGARYMSLLLVNEDHFAREVVYAPGRYELSRAQLETRYAAAIVRTFVDLEQPDDIAAVQALQDAIVVEQASAGSFGVPAWDPASQKAIRQALATLGEHQGDAPGQRFGWKDEVDPVSGLIGTAVGWGGNPPAAAWYRLVTPERNDGTVVHRLTVTDVPVVGFWSITVYDQEGFMVPNERGVYSVNDVTATRDADGAVTIQFGGCADGVPNCLPTPPGWNYTVRLYRPRTEVLDGTWTFPSAEPVG